MATVHGPFKQPDERRVMGKITGFLEIDREDRATSRRPIASGITASS